MTCAGLLITCEHGGHRIPAAYRALFATHQALLQTHRGFDIGALDLARGLAGALAAPLVAATVSRLLVDLNRSPGHPRLHAASVAHLPLEARQRLLRRHYQPYRDRVERLVRQAIAAHGRVIHLGVHSFTPELAGRLRHADIGLLYDPARAGEAGLCARWQIALQTRVPGLVVRRNYPYTGKADGLPAWLRRRLPAEVYIGIELEVNQRHFLAPGLDSAGLPDVLAASLRSVLAEPARPNLHPPHPQGTP